MIEIDHVDKWYGQFSGAKDFTTSVAKGEVVVVAAGRAQETATLIKCVNALEPIQAARSFRWHQGQRSQDRSAELRARVGMVFQHFELFPHLRIIDNLCLAQEKVFGRGHDEATDKAMRLLERVGLKEHAKKYPAELSGGQQQRVAIAARSPWTRSRCCSTSRPRRSTRR